MDVIYCLLITRHKNLSHPALSALVPIIAAPVTPYAGDHRRSGGRKARETVHLYILGENAIK